MAVFIKKGTQPRVYITSSSSFPGFTPAAIFFDSNGEQHTGLCAREYRHAVRRLILDETYRDMSHGQHAAVLVHDLDPSHKGKCLASICERQHIKSFLLPPRSPDLSPLDSGFWGSVTNKLERESRQYEYDWQTKCCRFIALIKEEDPDKYIDQMPLHVKACQLAHGWHIESELERLKRLR